MSDIDEFKARFQRLLELREEQDIDAAKANKSKAAYDEYEAELWAAVKEAGIAGSQTFDFGSEVGKVRFTARKPTLYGRVIDKDAALASLQAEGLSEVIFEQSIRKGRLNELVRDRLEARGELPDGVDFYDDKGITISRKG